MKHEEGTFAGLGGVSIFHQRWLPEGPPRTVLLVTHGYAEHSGRYGNLVDYVLPRGYAVYANDHRGHGHSGGERIEVDSFYDYVSDLKSFFDMVREDNPDQRIYLLGHSMGAGIAVLYAARYQHELDGLIISGPGTGARSRQSGQQPAIDLAATVSRDPAVVEAYRNDPLVYHDAHPASRLPAVLEFRDAMPAASAAIALPLLIMAGSASPLGDAEGAQNLYDAASSTDKTLKLHDGLMHEIFNEPERDQVFADLVAWLEERA